MADPIMPEPIPSQPGNHKPTLLVILAAALLVVIALGILLVLRGLRPQDAKAPAAVLSPTPATQDISNLESLLSTADTNMATVDNSITAADQSFVDQPGDLSE